MRTPPATRPGWAVAAVLPPPAFGTPVGTTVSDAVGDGDGLDAVGDGLVGTGRAGGR